MTSHIFHNINYANPSVGFLALSLSTSLTLAAEHADQIVKLESQEQASARIINIRRLAAALLEATDADREALADQYKLPLEIVDAWIEQTKKKNARLTKNARNEAIFFAYRAGRKTKDIATAFGVSISTAERIIRVQKAKAGGKQTVTQLQLHRT